MGLLICGVRIKKRRPVDRKQIWFRTFGEIRKKIKTVQKLFALHFHYEKKYEIVSGTGYQTSKQVRDSRCDKIGPLI